MYVLYCTQQQKKPLHIGLQTRSSGVKGRTKPFGGGSFNLEEKSKRKSTTSSESKMKYNKKTYTRLILDVRKEEAEKYKERCAEMGIPYSKPLHEAIKKIIGEFEKND